LNIKFNISNFKKANSVHGSTSFDILHARIRADTLPGQEKEEK